MSPIRKIMNILPDQIICNPHKIPPIKLAMPAAERPYEGNIESELQDDEELDHTALVGSLSLPTAKSW